MDIILQTLQAIGYLVLLVVLVFLWRRALHPSEFQNFWRLLAAAWTLNLLSNAVWIVHDLVTGRTLATLSVLDLFYVSRYILVGLALWLYPMPLSRRSWFWVSVTLLAVIVIVRGIYFEPAMTLRPGDWAFFLGLALYPVLDAASIALAWIRVNTTQQDIWGRYAFLLFCAVTSYGIANTLNLTEYTLIPLSGGILPNVFWILTDVFLLVMALTTQARTESLRQIRIEK